MSIHQFSPTSKSFLLDHNNLLVEVWNLYDCFSLFFFDLKWKATLPPTIMVQWKMGCFSNRIVSFHLGSDYGRKAIRLFYGLVLKGRGYSITTSSSTLTTRKAWRLRWWWTLQWSCNRESRPSIFAPCVNSKKFWDSARKSSSSSSSSLLDSVGFHRMVTIQWLRCQWS